MNKLVKVTYIGPIDEVTLAEYPLAGTIARGATVDVPEELAARLLAQAGTWRAGPKAPKPEPSPES